MKDENSRLAGHAVIRSRGNDEVPLGEPRAGVSPDLEREIEPFVASRIAPRTRAEYRKALHDFLGASGVADLAGLIAIEPDDIVRYRGIGRSSAPWKRYPMTGRVPRGP